MSRHPNTVMSPQQLKNIIEAALFASRQPLNVSQLGKLFAGDERPEPQAIKALLQELASDWEGRGLELKQVSSGYRFQVRTELSPWISRLSEERPPRYSRALLETLALIVYRQPITRAGIEEVRGVAVSSSIMKTLMEREWVRIVGHREVPGKPALYGTTRKFLDDFNLKTLAELPPLSEIRPVDHMQKELELRMAEESLETEGKDTGEDDGATLEGALPAVAADEAGAEAANEEAGQERGIIAEALH